MDSGQTIAPSSQRHFLALWPDDCVRGQLAAHAEQWQWPKGCARYAPEDWHVTLHFMGDVAADKVPAIAAASALPFQVFDLVFDQPMLWPRGLAVLGASKVPKALQTLHEQLGAMLKRLALPVESRAYRPHVTLAHHAEVAIPPNACVPLVWRVNGVALVVSTGQKEGRYRVLRQYR